MTRFKPETKPMNDKTNHIYIYMGNILWTKPVDRKDQPYGQAASMAKNKANMYYIIMKTQPDCVLTICPYKAFFTWVENWNIERCRWTWNNCSVMLRQQTLTVLSLPGRKDKVSYVQFFVFFTVHWIMFQASWERNLSIIFSSFFPTAHLLTAVFFRVIYTSLYSQNDFT